MGKLRNGLVSLVSMNFFERDLKCWLKNFQFGTSAGAVLLRQPEDQYSCFCICFVSVDLQKRCKPEFPQNFCSIGGSIEEKKGRMSKILFHRCV